MNPGRICNPCLGELTAHGQGPAPSLEQAGPACDFAEARVWEALGGGWKCLHGCFCQHGVSVEWHDFACEQPRDWARSFHPGSVELCLNVSGHARLMWDGDAVLVGPMTVALYATGARKLSAWRLPGANHQFLTVEYSEEFLRRHLTGHESNLHPVAQLALRPGCDAAQAGSPVLLSPHWRKAMERLRAPPIAGPAAAIWYEGKALELLAEFFFVPKPIGGTGGPRQQRTAQQRVDRSIEILTARLAEPPSLEELGREVGCSPYHLSRTFSRTMGMTIPQYLRQIRMERAADLLKSGRFNVTEAALEVGYNSLSHFSQAFCETMGCCPGLYPLGLTRTTGAKSAPATTAGSATRRQ